jgi:predicted amidohydrolase YtcJ
MTGTVIEAAGRNIDLHLHAIGDGAVRAALDAIEAARTTHPDTLSRFTICHIEVVDSQDIPRFAALNVVGQTTPTWFEYDYLALEYLGRARFQQLYPIASIRRQGAKITLGSDYPVTWIGEDALNPMFNIEMAVTRQQAGNRDYPIQAKISERLSVDQAIRAHTIDAAWQLGLEDDIGSLELNKLADFVILDEDPYAVPIYDLHRIQVNRTYSDGRLVYERRP